MRPMDPAELISKAEELFATFEPAKMSLDAHADAKLEEWRVRDPDDAVFLRQVLYGVTRYARFLGVVVRAFMHHNAATVLRRDKNTYTMYAYLALLRLDELGFQQFRCARGRMVPPRPRILFLFRSRRRSSRARSPTLRGSPANPRAYGDSHHHHDHDHDDTLARVHRHPTPPPQTPDAPSPL
jgi:hypothetical protein